MGAFGDVPTAEEAIDGLRRAGFAAEQIGFVVRDPTAPTVRALGTGRILVAVVVEDMRDLLLAITILGRYSPQTVPAQPLQSSALAQTEPRPERRAA